MGAATYRGPERRRAVDADVGGRAWMLAASTLLVTLGVVVWLVLDDRSRALGATSLTSLYTAETVLAVVMVATALAHWRAVGRTHGLRVAVAGSLLGLAGVLDLVDVARAPVAFPDGVRSALNLAAVVWVGRAVLGPEVDTSLRARREFSVAGVVALGIVAFVVLTVEALGGGEGVAPATWCLLTAVTWFGLALVGIVRSVARSWGLLGWVSWAGVALGISELARWEAKAFDGAWTFVSGAMGGAGLLIGAIGGIWALARVATTHRSDLYGMILDGRTQHAREQGQRRELAHEIRNALLAVEGATATMERLGDRLSDDQRRQLQGIVHAGMASLRALVEDPTPRDGQPFRLDDLVGERVAAAEARGVHVELEASRPVEVVGDPSTTGRALDNLLLNAERHGGAGGGEPITVTVAADVDLGQDAARGLVRVMDRGPGVPAADRRAVFEEGYQVHPGRGGDGIGLHAARELVVQQRGSLHYEDRPGGGACFVLSLPLAVRDLEPAGGPVKDEVDDGR